MSSASRELKINFPTYFSTLRASLQQQGVEAGAGGGCQRQSVARPVGAAADRTDE